MLEQKELIQTFKDGLDVQAGTASERMYSWIIKKESTGSTAITIESHVAPETEAFNQANDVLRDFQAIASAIKSVPPEQSATRPNYSLLRAQVKFEIRVSYEREGMYCMFQGLCR
jgi:hypothetical protein